MHPRSIAWLFVTLGLFAACSETERPADDNDDAAEGGAGMGGAGATGGEGAAPPIGGSGGTGGGTAGAGACGGTVCDADQTCHSCDSDDLSEGTQYSCAPIPQPQMGELACGWNVCIRQLQYCRNDTGDCEFPAECAEFPPDCFDCECLLLDPCVRSCEVDGDGAIYADFNPYC
jgi:hypothetical protein